MKSWTRSCKSLAPTRPESDGKGSRTNFGDPATSGLKTALFSGGSLGSWREARSVRRAEVLQPFTNPAARTSGNYPNQMDIHH
jgi:hypothetical protein